VNVLAATIAMKNIVVFAPIFWARCVPGKSLFRIFATSFHFYFTCKVELSVVFVLSFSFAPHASDFPC